LSFDCGRSDVQRLIGNAVPSLLAKVLAREIRCQLLGERRNGQSLKLMPPVRKPMPPPERVTPVPAKYLSMIGVHADHPGEGKLSGKYKKARSGDPSFQSSLLSATE